jgi:AraC-like DNA-binding protein
MHVANEAVRAEWTSSIARHCQVFMGRALALTDVGAMPGLANELVGSVAPPASHAEDLLLRSVLVEAAFKWGTWAHGVVHRSAPDSCRFSPAGTLGSFWRTPASEARAAFRIWAVDYARELERVHPPSVAQRAAAVLRTQYAGTWSAKSLARAVGTAPSVLRREFQREYGLGVRRFHSRVRLRVALERIVHGGEKIEPVALEVGFRSKKTLYRVVRELTGTTPGGLRDLPPEQAGKLLDASARTKQL